MDVVALRELTIRSLINELYNKWGCDPMYYSDDTATGKQARLDFSWFGRKKNMKGRRIIDEIRISCG